MQVIKPETHLRVRHIFSVNLTIYVVYEIIKQTGHLLCITSKLSRAVGLFLTKFYIRGSYPFAPRLVYPAYRTATVKTYHSLIRNLEEVTERTPGIDLRVPIKTRCEDGVQCRGPKEGRQIPFSTEPPTSWPADKICSGDNETFFRNVSALT